MGTTSLADLKRKQQLRKQQQQKQNKRKREPDTTASASASALATTPSSQPTLDKHFRRAASTGHSLKTPAVQANNKLQNYFQRTTSLNLASSILASAATPESKAPFAAAPRRLKLNPFDIISELEAEQNATTTAAEFENVVVVGAGGNISDSDNDQDDGADPALDPAALGDDEEIFENDPSLYKLSTRPLPLQSSFLLLQTPKAEGISNRGHGINSAIENRSHLSTKNDSATSAAEKYLSDKPLQTLSLRTHVSVSSSQPLDALERLKDDGSLLAMTSLCSPDLSPLNLLADALMYWEITGIADPRQQTTPEPRQSTNIASAGQIQQAFVSLFRLQAEAPTKYPFMYLQTRDYTVVFRMNSLADSAGGYRREALINHSSLGLRKTLHAEGIEFAVPLAPTAQNWSEIPGAINADPDTYFLRTTSFDKTWKSALLITDLASVNGLFSHLYSTPLGTAKLFSSGPFLNATMRRQSVRISSAVSYEDGVEKTLHKLDTKGVIFPNTWNTILTSLSEIIAGGFHATSKESPDTEYLTMLVTAQQSNAVASRRSVAFSNGKYIYS